MWTSVSFGCPYHTSKTVDVKQEVHNNSKLFINQPFDGNKKNHKQYSFLSKSKPTVQH